MVPQILMNVIQIGAKFCFDLDPVITEHVTRHIAAQAMVLAQTSGEILLQVENKFSAYVMPVLDGARTLKVHLSNS